MAMGQNNNRYPNNPNGNRGRRPVGKRRREKVPGAVIAIYVMMAVLILAICALVFVITLRQTGWNGKNQPDSSGVVISPSNDPGDASGDSTGPADDNSVDSADSASDNSSHDWTISSSDSSSDAYSVITSDSSSGWSNSHSNVIFINDYDPEVFANDLFIGDSIFTGLYLYGYMDNKNVAAKVGYTPYNALHKPFDQTNSGSAVDYAANMKPTRVFIMLGSNAVGAGANLNVINAQYYDLLIELKRKCPDSMICVISVPPVTADSTAAKNAQISNDTINEFNDLLKSTVKKAGVTFFDFNKMAKDSSGYFAAELAEMDGLHFKGNTYKVLLSALQREVIKENIVTSGGE